MTDLPSHIDDVPASFPEPLSTKANEETLQFNPFKKLMRYGSREPLYEYGSASELVDPQYAHFDPYTVQEMTIVEFLTSISDTYGCTFEVKRSALLHDIYTQAGRDYGNLKYTARGSESDSRFLVLQITAGHIPKSFAQLLTQIKCYNNEAELRRQFWLRKPTLSRILPSATSQAPADTSFLQPTPATTVEPTPIQASRASSTDPAWPNGASTWNMDPQNLVLLAFGGFLVILAVIGGVVMWRRGKAEKDVGMKSKMDEVADTQKLISSDSDIP